MAHPFLKWAGGKSQLLSELQALYPSAKDCKRYFEPFVGGGAVFFDVRVQRSPQEIFLSDNNEELITTWRVIRDDLNALLVALREHEQKHRRLEDKHYYAVRELSPKTLSPVEKAARMIYLNKTCFNGLYRVNSKGLFNVPVGRYENPAIVNEENLRLVSEALKPVSLEIGHFSNVLEHARAGDFVYFDPPYHPVSKTASFTSYTESSFTELDQRRLADVFTQLAEKGVNVMLSNSDVPLIRQLYKDFRVETRSASRLINSAAAKRGNVNEVIVISYTPPVGGKVIERSPRLRAKPAARAGRKAAK